MTRVVQRSEPYQLSHSLLRSLDLYAVAAAASVSVLALAKPSEAQIVYTPAHRGMGRDSKMAIDFNHDGRIDFVIREFPWNLIGYPGNVVQAYPEPKGGIQAGPFGMAAELVSGSAIGSSKRFVSKSAFVASATSYGVYYGYVGSWNLPANAYLGVQFMIDGQKHYGWARLSAQFNWRTQQIDVILTGYAYESQPNTLIHAGDTGQAVAPGDESKSIPAPASETKGAATLGVLAAGTRGIPLWRPEKSATVR